MDYWRERANWLFEAPTPLHRDAVWDDLVALADFVAKHVLIGFDFEDLRLILFLPFQGEWNRKVTLMVQWLIALRADQLGRHPDWEALEGEWQLSGLTPPARSLSPATGQA